MMKSWSLYLVAVMVILLMPSLGTESHALDKASISAPGTPKCMTPGQTATASVTVTNQGDTSWSSAPAAAVAGCSNADNCPVHLSYHLIGPMNMANGLRTDLPETIAPQISKTFTAQIKASDTFGTEAPLPLGKYTLSWQMVREHIGWIEAVTSYTVEVKNSCDQTGSGPSIGLHKGTVGALNGRLKAAISTDPYISQVVAPPLTQGQEIAIGGKHFGDSPGSATLKGTFKQGGQDVTTTVELPIIPGMWADNVVGAGPIPAGLIGLDQQVEIQVKSKDNKLSNVKKVAFVAKREVKQLPRSAMTGQLAIVGGDIHEQAISDPAQPQSLWVVHENATNAKYNCYGDQIKEDIWTAKLKDYQRYEGYLFSHWAGNFPQAPAVSVQNTNLTFPVKWAFEHTGYTHKEIWWLCYANYLANIYYTTPVGMD